MGQAAFQFRRRESVAEGAGRIAAGLTQQALRHIREPAQDRDEDLHEVRLAIKWLRALLRLLRPALAPERYRRSNLRLRSTARQLALLRDTAVARHTLEHLLAKNPSGQERSALESVRQALARRDHPESHFAGTRERALRKSVLPLEEMEHAFLEFDRRAAGWSVIESGLVKSYRQCRRAMKTACSEGRDEDFHEWRKMTKYLFYLSAANGRESLAETPEQTVAPVEAAARGAWSRS